MHICLEIAKLRSKIKLSTLKNVWVQSFHFLIFRSVKHTWARRASRTRRARGHIGHVGHVSTLGTPFSRLRCGEWEISGCVDY